MYKPLFLFIGNRYAGLKRKNQFTSFMSLTSIIGIALGVTVLITVLSVMNGFGKEIRAQMLSITPHITLKASRGYLKNWDPLLKELKNHKKVKGAAPYVLEQGMLTGVGAVRGVVVTGILPSEINNVFPLENNIVDGSIDNLENKKFSMVLGKDLAANLGVLVGDKITLLVPESDVSPAGVMPRLKRFEIVGIYNTGTYYDNRNVFINLKDASILYRLANGITGIQLKVEDEFEAVKISKEIAKEYDYNYKVTDWTYEFETFFDALKMEKTVMWCILLLIIAVAAFNLVSSLVMIVTDKKSDIAILRTMGVKRREIVGIFIVQGVIVGVIGTILGLIFGLLLAYNVTQIVEFVQGLFNVQFISEDIYFVGYVPSKIEKLDVISICFFSLFMSFVSTLYPAYRAASIKPAEALRYE